MIKRKAKQMQENDTVKNRIEKFKEDDRKLICALAEKVFVKHLNVEKPLETIHPEACLKIALYFYECKKDLT